MAACELADCPVSRANTWPTALQPLLACLLPLPQWPRWPCSPDKGGSQQTRIPASSCLRGEQYHGQPSDQVHPCSVPATQQLPGWHRFHAGRVVPGFRALTDGNNSPEDGRGERPEVCCGILL